MATITKPLPTIGVDKYTFFKVESEDENGIVYGSAYSLPGTVEIVPTDSGSTSVFDADNGIYEASAYLDGVGHEITNADIPPEVDAIWRGLEMKNGIVEVGAAVNDVKFAAAWRILKSDGTYRYFRCYKGVYTFASNVGGKTKASSGAIDRQTAKASYTALQRDCDGMYYAYIDESDLPDDISSETLCEQWFTDPNWVPEI